VTTDVLGLALSLTRGPVLMRLQAHSLLLVVLMRRRWCVYWRWR
jgi:hypothetical protein